MEKYDIILQPKKSDEKNNGMAAIKGEWLRNKTLICLLALVFLCALLCNGDVYAGGERIPVIVLKATSFTIRQEESLPTYEVEITCEGKESEVLDSSTGYCVGDLVEDLQNGKYYELNCDGDNVTEGTFPIQILMEEEITTAVTQQWVGKVTVQVLDGLLTVENKTGYWNGETRFCRWDGTDVISDFVTADGKTYYFDAQGEKVTGLVDVEKKTYYFDETGIMQTGWLSLGEDTYYLEADGAMANGWREVDGNTYYFTFQGQMLKGEQRVGMYVCIFGEDGILQSKTQSIDPSKPMIAITFDDGPGKDTARLLDALEKNGAHATFFMLGTNVDKYATEVARMLEIGCEIGNHSTNHSQLTKLTQEQVAQEISITNQKLLEASGRQATVFRPPYGDTDDMVAKTCQLPQILWSVDTLDWETKSKESTVEAILGAVDGDIVLLHDIHDWSVDAAIEAIPQLIERGYQVVTVSELAQARGVTLERGEKYSNFYPQ